MNTLTPIFAHIFTLTGFAIAATSIKVSVEQIVGMPLWTMSSTGIFSRWPYAPQHVISHYHRFQMCGVNAKTNTAKMVKCESFGNWAYKKLISKAMGFRQMPAYSELSIALSDSRNPQPAPVGLLNLGPKTFLYRIVCVLIWHKQTAFHQHAAGTRRVGSRRLCNHYTTQEYALALR